MFFLMCLAFIDDPVLVFNVNEEKGNLLNKNSINFSIVLLSFDSF